MLKFIVAALRTNFRLSIALKASFLITLFIVIATHTLFLISWNFFFMKYKTLQGWNFNEMILMYGILSFSIGFTEMFFYGIRELPRMIESQQLDPFLVQPKNVILNIAMSKGDIAAAGELFLGIILICYSGYIFHSEILLVIPLTILCMFSFRLYLSSFAFFIKNPANLLREIHQNTNIIANQPNSAYRGFFRLLTMTVLPIAFISFFPVEYLRTHLFKNYLFATIGTFSFFILACRMFKSGLKRYESGNNISLRQ